MSSFEVHYDLLLSHIQSSTLRVLLLPAGGRISVSGQVDRNEPAWCRVQVADDDQLPGRKIHAPDVVCEVHTVRDSVHVATHREG